LHSWHRLQGQCRVPPPRIATRRPASPPSVVGSVKGSCSFGEVENCPHPAVRPSHHTPASGDPRDDAETEPIGGGALEAVALVPHLDAHPATGHGYDNVDGATGWAMEDTVRNQFGHHDEGIVEPPCEPRALTRHLVPGGGRSIHTGVERDVHAVLLLVATGQVLSDPLPAMRLTRPPHSSGWYEPSPISFRTAPRRCSMTLLSRRETWTWEIPISSAISDCERPS
jgi:hypothetical protein